MGTIDIIIIICLLPSIFFGLKKGLIKQIVSLCVLFFGIKLSLQFSAPVSGWLSQHITISPFALKTISFVVIFSAVAIVLSLIGRLVEKIIQITLLEWVNKVLGLILSFSFFLIALSVLAYFFDSANNLMHIVSQENIGSSKLYPMLLDFSKLIFPYFKELF